MKTATEIASIRLTAMFVLARESLDCVTGVASVDFGVVRDFEDVTHILFTRLIRQKRIVRAHAHSSFQVSCERDSVATIRISYSALSSLAGETGGGTPRRDPVQTGVSECQTHR